MRTHITCLLALLLGTSVTAHAQARLSKAEEELERLGLDKPVSIYDRAGGLHNRSNIGLWFENRGKLYPRRVNPATPCGEFPLGSGKEYIYRANPFVGVPGNVIQGRWRENEEWEAAAGYHNRDSVQVATSDKPYTWPSAGWPVKDANGNPIFVSDQDTYCVYNDSNNTISRLDLAIIQTGYAFSLETFENMIFFTFQVVNNSTRTYDSLYFALYLDMDIGNLEGGVANEYEDDRVGIDLTEQLVYFYDDGRSVEWPGGTTGQFGWTMLQTPEVNGVEPGITDFHYNIYNDDLDEDSIQYGIMSSAASLYVSSWGPKFFHVGANYPNLHYDDPATIPASGIDLLGYMSSGPYTIMPNDTLTFVTAAVAGESHEELLVSTQRARQLFKGGYIAPRPPDPPVVRAFPGDREVTVMWDNRSESYRDPFTGNIDFQGYRLYKSTDRGQHWDQIDRNQYPQTGEDPVPLGDFDKVDGIGNDRGLQYSYVDTNVVNGFEYWYTVTAYDYQAGVPSLESGRPRNKDNVNVGVAVPLQDPIGTTPVQTSDVSVTGIGRSNAVWNVQATNVPEAGDRTYDVQFSPLISVARGNPRSIMTVTLDTVLERTSETFALLFTSATRYRAYNLSRGGSTAAPPGTYTSGSPIRFEGLRITITDTSSNPEYRIEAGDSLIIRAGILVHANPDTVLPLRAMEYGTRYSTSNGIMLGADLPYPIRSITQVSGANPVTLVETITDIAAVPDQRYTFRFDSVWAVEQVTYASVSLRDSMGRKIAGDTYLQTGDYLDAEGQGFLLTMTWDPGNPPEIRTAHEIVSVKQKPATYRDSYRFTTQGATSTPQAVAAELGRVRVVPNPYLISSLFEEEFGVLRREPIRQLKFTHLPPVCTITIFTLDGDKVKVIEHTNGEGVENWDMKSDGGRVIAPGIYIYLVKTESAEKIDRFAVIK